MTNRRLIKFNDLPTHLQFNPYILNGYRPLLDTKECVSSLSYWHNETLNIYSHILGLAYFLLYSLYQYWYIWPTNSWSVVSVFICIDYVSTSLPYSLSVIYHTFMCHKGGPKLYQTILQIDIIGIWIFGTFGELGVIYVTLYCHQQWTVIGITSYLIFSLFVLVLLNIYRDKISRTFVFTLQLLFRVFILMIKISPYGCGPSHTTICYIVLEAMCGLGALINALHFPEKWLSDGRGYLLSGHTVMHVMGTCGMLIGRIGFINDMRWINNNYL